MRLFLPQNLGPDEPTTPPFLTDREEDQRLALLRETTQHVKEGRNRLATPEKTAIMQLSTSFEKRRLGKQQQILSEMTQRCREQEVNDLSVRITAKCDLKSPGRGQGLNQLTPGREQPPYFSTTTNTYKGAKHRLSDIHLDSVDNPQWDASESNIRVDSEKTYKFFPARRIMRQQTKINFIAPNLARLSTVNVPKGLRKSTEYYMNSNSRSPRYNGYAHAFDANSPRRLPSHSTQPVVPSRGEPLAPLVLPRLSLVDTGYQDRIDSYFSSNRIRTVPRAKTFYDTTSISGRSYKSMLNLSGPATTKQVNVGRSDTSGIQLGTNQDEDLGSLESVGRPLVPSMDNLVGQN